MPGIFISHSSADKSFVRKLAIDLVIRGFPVWFDSWELEIGDSLLNKLYDGIDASTYLMILLSPQSVVSRWVEKELNAALTKEDQIGRKFVIPIIVSECQVPLKIADRIYADFSKSYLSELEKLAAIFRSKGLHKVGVSRERQIIPLLFTKGINLQTTALAERLNSLCSTTSSDIPNLKSNQFVISQDQDYLKLKEKLFYRMEHIEDDPFYSAEFHNSFAENYHNVFRLEEWLIEGIRMIISEVPRTLTSIPDACYWFAKIVRSEILYVLWLCQRPDSTDSVEVNEQCKLSLGFNRDAAVFFGVKHVLPCHIGLPVTINGFQYPDTRLSFSAWIDTDSPIGKHLHEALPHVAKLRDEGDSELYSKYLIPQMLNKHFKDTRNSLMWAFADYVIAYS